MHLEKTAIHLKKVSSVGGTDPAIEVTLRYPTSRLGAGDMGLLMAYVGHAVRVTIDARDVVLRDPDEPLPLDRALEESENGHGRPERARPLGHERCGLCAHEIGEDPESGFYVPFAGRPVPMHGACLAEIPDNWAPDEDDVSARLADNPTPAVGEHQILEDLLGLVNLGPTVPVSEWTAEERQAATEWVESVKEHDEAGVTAELPAPDFLAEKTWPLPVASDSAASDEVAESEAGATEVTGDPVVDFFTRENAPAGVAAVDPPADEAPVATPGRRGRRG